METSTTSLTKTKSLRKPHFSNEEIVILLEEVEANYGYLYGAFCPSIDKSKKKKLWQELVNKINSVSTVTRTCQEVKHKWQDLQLKAKKKEAHRLRMERGTGGGPAPKQLSQIEEKVVAIIPKVSTQGIHGGVDTFSSPVQSAVLPSTVYEEALPVGTKTVPHLQASLPFLPIEADKEGDIIINMATGEEIVHTSISVIEVGLSPAVAQIEDTTVRCGLLNKKPVYMIDIFCNLLGKARREVTIGDPTIKLLHLEEEKVKLKKRKLDLLEERNRIELSKLEIERSRLNVLETIASRLEAHIDSNVISTFV